MLGHRYAVPSLASLGAFYPGQIRWGEAKVDWMLDWDIGRAGLSPSPWGLGPLFSSWTVDSSQGLSKRVSRLVTYLSFFQKHTIENY